PDQERNVAAASPPAEAVPRKPLPTHDFEDAASLLDEIPRPTRPESTPSARSQAVAQAAVAQAAAAVVSPPRTDGPASSAAPPTLASAVQAGTPEPPAAQATPWMPPSTASELPVAGHDTGSVGRVTGLESGSPPAVSEVAAFPAAPPSGLAETDRLDMQAWSSAQVVRSRVWLLAGAGTVMVVGMILGLVGYAVSRPSGDSTRAPTEVAVNAASDPIAATPALPRPAGDHSKPADDDPQIGPPIADNTPASPAPDANDPEPSSEVPPSSPLVVRKPATTDPASEVPPQRETTDPAVTNQPDAPTPEPAVAPVQPAPTTADEPPGLVAATPDSSRDDIAMATDVDRQLDSLTPMLSIDQSNNAPDLPAAPSDQRMDEERPPRPAPREVDIQQRLADRFPSIEIKRMGLADFVQFLTDFSTIPITLETESFPWTGASVMAPVSIEAQDMTVAQLLDRALAPYHLTYLVDGEHVVVTRQSKFREESRLIRHQIGDLAPDELQQGHLREMVLKLVAPTTWKGAGGTGTCNIDEQHLAVNHVEPVQLKVLMFLEKLRLARGLARRTSFQHPAFELDPRWQQTDVLLAKPVTATFLRDQPLVRILQHLGKQVGCRVIVDWRSLQSEGWTPESLGTLVVHDVPFREGLAELLRPMDLAIRPIDAGTVQVVTAADLASQVELEFYQQPVAPADAETFLAECKKAVGEHLLEDGGGDGVLLFDSASRCLLALLPQPQHALLHAHLRTSK
ncbi:MAG: hypothetical protein KDA37_00025, partial [Planctomycetales bacterium]|nr:hypothetical protein [Planctomycetales bacterium]